MSKIVKYLIVFLAVVFLFIFVRQVDYDEVFSQVLMMKWWTVAILLATFGAYLMAAKAWQLSFGSENSIIPKLKKLFVIRQIGETLTLINPTNIVGGELSKIYMLRSSDLASGEVETSIVLSRGLIILSYIFLVIVTLLFYILQSSSFSDQKWVILFVLFAAVFFYCLFYVITSKRLLLHSVSRRLFSFLRLSRFNKFVSGVYKMNKTLYRFYTEKRDLMILAFAYSLGHWILGSLEFYFILTALDYNISFFDAVTIEMGVMAFKSIGGFVPGQIGNEEYGNKFMLGILGFPDTDLWIVVSILRRARQLFWIALSLIFLGIFYKSYRWRSSS